MLPPEPDLTNPDEVLVRVEGVSKKFCRSLKKSLWYGVQDIAAELNPFGRKAERLNDENLNFDPVSDQESRFKDESTLRDGEFWAVKDVSFELRRGECLGLIGHNGAGKTTLLKMLNGLIKPDRGTITMRGRVGALIALGAGFNPILTGRENIYVNGSVLGLSKKEIDEKMDEIIDFAEIGKFIDTPVQNYSSGMSVRLGFSAAANLINPDVLILDEVLAVGDAEFRSKCLLRVSALLDSAAVIFVSHQEGQLQRVCDRILWLKGGRTHAEGDIGETLARYAQSQHTPEFAPSIHGDYRGLTISDPAGTRTVTIGEDLEVCFNVCSEVSTRIETFILGIKNQAMDVVAQTWIDSRVELLPGKAVRVRIGISEVRLRPGRYYMNLNLAKDNGKVVLLRANNVISFEVNGGVFSSAAYQPDSSLLDATVLN